VELHEKLVWSLLETAGGNAFAYKRPIKEKFWFLLPKNDGEPTSDDSFPGSQEACVPSESRNPQVSDVVAIGRVQNPSDESSATTEFFEGSPIPAPPQRSVRCSSRLKSMPKPDYEDKEDSDENRNLKD
jgi:hypothetical protein